MDLGAWHLAEGGGGRRGKGRRRQARTEREVYHKHGNRHRYGSSLDSGQEERAWSLVEHTS